MLRWLCILNGEFGVNSFGCVGSDIGQEISISDDNKGGRPIAHGVGGAEATGHSGFFFFTVPYHYKINTSLDDYQIIDRY